MPSSLLPAFLLAACSYVAEVDTALESAPAVSLSGTVTTTDATAPAGPAVVLRYAAEEPPPPDGFGSPVDISTAPAASWSSAGGISSAPWSMTGVSSGTWLLTALVDEDSNFDPLYDITAGVSCGDRTGAYVDSATASDPLAVTVEAPDAISDLSVLVGSPLTTERPAFSLSHTDTTLHQTDGTATFELLSVAVTHELLNVNGPTADTCPALFQVRLPDEDGDGEIDPHPDETYAQYGLKDVWPKVYLSLDQPDEGTLEEGESWLAEAVVYGDAFLAAGAEAGDSLESDTLPVVFVAAALHVLPDGTEEVVTAPDLPAGEWMVVVVGENGQTWHIPNALGDSEVSESMGAAADETQAAGIRIE